MTTVAHSYPLSLPSTPAPRSSVVRLRRAVAYSQSGFSYVGQAQKHPGAQWVMEFEYPPMNRAQAAAWQAFFLKLQGRFGTFYAGDPDAKTPRGTIAATSAVTNLLTRSEEFDHADWTTAAATVTANATTAPDGTSTADQVAHRGSGGAFDLVSQTAAASASTAYTASVFVKNNNSATSRFRIYDGSDNIATADISWSGATLTGMVEVTTADDFGYESIGSGWYRVWIVGTTGSGASTLQFQFEPDDDASGKSVYLWGAQMEAGSSRGRYVATTSSSATSAAGPFVSGGSQTGNQVVVGGANPGATALEADYIQIGGYMYAVVEDATADYEGAITLKIEPSLRSSPSDGASVTVQNCVTTMRLIDSEAVWSADALSIYGLSLRAIEALPTS